MEQLADIGREMALLSSKLRSVLESARAAKCLAIDRMTAAGMCADMLKRWAKQFRSESTHGLKYEPETMHFCSAAFQKVGRGGWTLLRRVLPVPHESTLRQATRGAVSDEGVKYLEIQRNMVEAVRRSKEARAAGSNANPSSVFDVVLAFDEMHVRSGFAWDAGSSEMRGYTTQLSMKTTAEFVSSSGAAASSKRCANAWLSFVATPLLGGYNCRFNVASFAVRSLSAGELASYLNTVLTALAAAGWRVRAVCCDGASCARRLQQKILTHSEADLLGHGRGLGATKVAFEDPTVRYAHSIRSSSRMIDLSSCQFQGGFYPLDFGPISLDQENRQQPVVLAIARWHAGPIHTRRDWSVRKSGFRFASAHTFRDAPEDQHRPDRTTARSPSLRSQLQHIKDVREAGGSVAERQNGTCLGKIPDFACRNSSRRARNKRSYCKPADDENVHLESGPSFRHPKREEQKLSVAEEVLRFYQP